jgi:hypothetical protein
MLSRTMDVMTEANNIAAEHMTDRISVLIMPIVHSAAILKELPDRSLERGRACRRRTD